MIAIDFAPNEDHGDARLALSLSVTPSGWYEGDSGALVEEKLTELFPNHRAALYFSARAALYEYLKALKLPPKSEVIVPGFTCEAVVIPIKALELTPVFADIDKETFSLDPTDVKKKITKNTKLIILQHTFGIPPHRTEILALAKKHKIPVIEDLAHGFDEQMVKKDFHKTDKLLSFGTAKAFSSVYGGAIMSENESLLKDLKESQNGLPVVPKGFLFRTLLYKPVYIFIKDTYDVGLGKLLHFTMNTLGVFPKVLSQTERQLGLDPYILKKYPNALATLALHQLNKFQSMQDIRRQVTDYYSDTHGLAYRGLPLGRFPLLIKNRDELRTKLAKKNIFLGRWYHYTLSKPGECPIADEISHHIINLPTLVTLEDAKRVCNEVENSRI